jgi:hypothetical protein
MTNGTAAPTNISSRRDILSTPASSLAPGCKAPGSALTDSGTARWRRPYSFISGSGFDHINGGDGND